jgi:hypothetical protein
VAIKIAEASGEDTQTTIVTRTHDRDEDQTAMDKRVAGLVKRWTEAGKPAQATAPFLRLTVPKEQRSAVKKLIRRATVLAKVEPLYWQDTKPNSDGEITVKFTVGPKREKPATETPAAATPTVPAPAPTPAPPAQDEKRGGLLSGRR